MEPKPTTMEQFLKTKMYKKDEKTVVQLTEVYDTQKETTATFPLGTPWEKYPIALEEKKILRVQVTPETIEKTMSQFWTHTKQKVCSIHLQTPFPASYSLPFPVTVLPSDWLFQATTLYWSLPVNDKTAMERLRTGGDWLYVPMAMQVRQDKEWIEEPLPFRSIVGKATIEKGTTMEKEEQFFMYVYHVLSIAKHNRQSTILWSCKDLEAFRLSKQSIVAIFRHWLQKPMMNEAFSQCIFCDCSPEWKKELYLLQH